MSNTHFGSDILSIFSGINVEEIFSIPGWIAKDTKQIEYLATLMHKFGMPVTQSLSTGNSDASLFADIAPILMVRPISANQHGPEEWVDTLSAYCL